MIRFAREAYSEHMVDFAVEHVPMLANALASRLRAVTVTGSIYLFTKSSVNVFNLNTFQWRELSPLSKENHDHDKNNDGLVGVQELVKKQEEIPRGNQG